MKIEKTITNIWELSKESFQKDDACRELEKISLFLNWDLKRDIIIPIEQTNQSNDMNDYYSYYKIFDKKGKYKFSLPFGRFRSLNLRTSEFESLDSIITKYPHSSKSQNGGDYYSGYRIEKLIHPTIEMYKVTYSWALFSDFEDQCSEKPELIFSAQELAELDVGDILE
ncbi:MAG: hypothetical protein ACFFDN_45105 [Candidatus Hodarchaeota archaeon]